MANQIKYQVGFDVDKSSLNQLKSSLQQLSKVSLKDIMKINNVDAKQARQILDEVKKQAKQVESALDDAFNVKLNTANIETFKTALKGLDSQKLYQSFSRLGASGEIAFRQLSTQLLGTNVKLKETHTLLNKMGTTFVNTVKWNVASSAVNAMTRSIEQAWGFTKSLDGTLNDIRIVTGKSAEEMANFAVKANDAAQSLGRTTTDYTKAALIYAQQGLSDAEIEERAKITLKAANVTGQSADAVSEELTAVWNGYKVTAEEAELYVDRLAAVAATSASNLEELSKGMSKVASAAAAMGVGQDQLAAQLSTIISVTRQAPESVGTALRTVYARISDIKAGIDEDGVTLGNYTSKMANLGISVLDMNNNLRDMGEVMEQIGSKWGDMTREQQVSLAQTMAGQRQYSNLIALFDNFDKYNKELTIAQGAAGTLQKQQDIYMESTAAHLNTLKAAVESIYSSLGDTKAINSVIDGMTTAANFVSNFVQSLGGGKEVLASLGSLAFMVFSKQIGESLNTTINNIKIAREQTQFFKQALADAQEKENIGVKNDYTQSLLGDQAKLMKLTAGGGLSPEKFDQIRNSLLGLRDTANNIDIVNEKIGSVQTTFEKLPPEIRQTMNEMGGLDQMLASADGIEEIKNQLQVFQKDFKPLKDQLEELGQAYGKFENNVNKINTGFKNQSNAKHFGKQFKDSFKNIINDETFEKFPQEVQTKLQTAFNNIKLDGKGSGFSNIQEQVRTAFNAVKETIKQQIDSVDAALERISDKGTAEYEELLQKKAELEQLYKDQQQDKNLLLNESDSLARIQQFTAIAGSISSIAMAVQNLQNLGSIWSNSDLTIGEKLLQTFTNLGMVVGMIIPAYQKLNNIYQTYATTVSFLGVKMNEETAAKIKNIITTEAQNGADKKRIQEKVEEALLIAHNAGEIDKETITKVRNIVATKGAEAANESFKKSLLSNPFTAAAMAIMAIVVAVGALAKAEDQARQKQIELYKEQVEAENKKQEEIEKNKELYASLEEVNNQYKTGEISRLELKSAVQQLVEQYGVEGKALQELTSNYDNLTEAILRLKKENAEEETRSNLRKYEYAKNLTQTAAPDYAIRVATNNRIGFKGGDSLSSEIKMAFIEAGATESNGIYTFQVDWDSGESIVDFYDRLSSLRDILTENGAEDLPIFTQITNQMSKMSEFVEMFRDLPEDLAKSSTEALVANEQLSGRLDLQNIKTGNEYLKQRSKLIDLIQEKLYKADGNKYSNDEAINMADKILQEQYSDSFNKFGESATFISKFEKELGDFSKKVIPEIRNNILKIIETTDNVRLGQILKIDPKDVDSWSEVQKIIEYLATADLSSIQLDTASMFNEASSTFNTYDSLYDQVKSGKNISSKEFVDLEPEIQAFFGKVADGTYQMVGDAEEFYETVKNLSLSGFKENIQNLTGAITQLERIKDVSFNELSSSNSPDLTQQRFDYLAASGEIETSQLAEWDSVISRSIISQEDFIKITEEMIQAVNEVGDKTQQNAQNLKQYYAAIQQNRLAIARSADSYRELQQLLNTEQISQSAFDQAATEMHQAERLEDLDPDVIKNYADYLGDLAKSEKDAYLGAEKLSEDLIDNQQAAEDISIQVQRMNAGVEKLSKNWKTWSDILKKSSKGSKEYFDASSEVKEAVADLLDLSSDYISLDFVDTLANNTEAMQLMEQAANGDGEAIDKLRDLALEDIILNLKLNDGATLDNQELLHRVRDLQADLDDMGPLEVGTSLDLGGIEEGQDDFVKDLNQLIADANMGKQQVNAMLAGMGFTANYAEQDQKIVYKEPDQTITHHAIGNRGVTKVMRGNEVAEYETFDEITTTEVIPGKTHQGYYPAYSMQMSEPGTTVVPKINSVTKKATGSANNYSPSNAGNNNSGTNGGGNGSTGKQSKKDTSKKSKKETIEDERDIYHDINIKLQKVNRQYENIAKKQDRLFGKELTKNLNQQTEKLKEQVNLLKQKQAIQQKDLKAQQSALKKLGVKFQDNQISNYMDILGTSQNEINSLVNSYNSIVKKYNKTTNAKTKKSLKKKLDKLEKNIKKAEDDYQKLQDLINNYDELRSDMADVSDEIADLVQQQIEIKIQRFQTEIELRLELGQAKRDWNDFVRNVINKTNILKDSDFDSILKDAQLAKSNIATYLNFDNLNNLGSIQSLIDHLGIIQGQIKEMDAKGTSSIYGDNRAQALEDLKSDFEELKNQMQGIEESLTQIDQAYLDIIDAAQAQFDVQIEGYTYVGQLLEHDMNLITLLYGQKNYESMDKYYDKLVDNNKKQLDSLKKQAELWKKQWEKALHDDDINAAKKFEQNYKNAISNLNSLIESSAQTLQDQYANAINKIFDTFEKKITNGQGLDYLNFEWDLINKNAEDYLDTINTAFAIQQTERKYQDAIDATKNLQGQQQLKKVMEDQLSTLRERDQLTQYDVDRAEKVLQVQKARIALEEAQAAKSSMRLKRDAQGNYSYQYVADNAKVNEAQQNLAKAQNDLYNFDKEAYNKNLNEAAAALEDFENTYKEILTDMSLSEEDRIKKSELLQDEYNKYIQRKTKENGNIVKNLRSSAFDEYQTLYDKDLESFKKMTTEEQNNIMGLNTIWNNSIQSMMDILSAEEGGFGAIAREILGEIEDKTKGVGKTAQDYETSLDKLATSAGIDLEKVKNGWDAIAQSASEGITNNDILLEGITGQIEQINKVRDSVKEITKACEELQKNAIKALNEVNKLIQKETADAIEAPINNVLELMKKAGITETGYSASATSANNLTNLKNAYTAFNELESYQKAYISADQQKWLKEALDFSQEFANEIQRLEKQLNLAKQDRNDLTNNYNKQVAIAKGQEQSAKDLAKKTGGPVLTAIVTPDKKAYQANYDILTKQIAEIENQIKAAKSKLGPGSDEQQVARDQFANLDLSSAFLDAWEILSRPLGFSTGGYTGEWGKNGKLAILHQKELVLNENDTKNLLDSVSILRTMTTSLNTTFSTRMGSIKNRFSNALAEQGDLEQNVHIEASFPNVNSKKEIEEAFNDLINLAAQRAMRK